MPDTREKIRITRCEDRRVMLSVVALILIFGVALSIYLSLIPRDRLKAIGPVPVSAEDYVNRGNAYGRLGDYDKAIRDYDKAVSINPKLGDAYYNRGTAYGRTGDYDHSIEDLSTAIELNPKDVKAYKNRAIAWYSKRDYHHAWEDVRRCKKLGGQPDPSFVMALRTASGIDN